MTILDLEGAGEASEQMDGSLSPEKRDSMIAGARAEYGKNFADLLAAQLDEGKSPLAAMMDAMSNSDLVRDPPAETDNTMFTSNFSSRYKQRHH